MTPAFPHKEGQVCGYLRKDLHQVIETAGFDIVAETSHTYAPAVAELPPEEQVFLGCRLRRLKVAH